MLKSPASYSIHASNGDNDFNNDNIKQVLVERERPEHTLAS